MRGDLLVKLIKKHRWSIIVLILGISAMVLFNFSNHEEPATQEAAYTFDNRFSMLPLYWITGIVGGCIAATLSYVSWKKYKAQRKRNKD